MLISSSHTSAYTFAEPKETSQHSTDVKNSEEETKDEKKSSQDLSTNERQQVAQLQQRDSEVRAHEAAHIAAGGSAISGGASFTYEKGPDGRQYAVGGEVPISTSGGSTPQETISIARQIQSAALAPASPSPQDLKVAASAVQMEAQARQDLAQEKSEEQQEKEISTYSENQEELKEDDKHSFDLSA